MTRYDPGKHHRRSIRLRGYDYARPGAYFVTICTHDRGCLFGDIVAGQMRLNEAGCMVQKVWDRLPERFPFMAIDEYVIMPNHLHGIIVLTGDHKDRPYEMRDRRGESCIRPSPIRPCPGQDHPRGTLAGTVSRILQAFKSITTQQYANGVRNRKWPPFEKRLWQRNYYEHVIRTEDEWHEIRAYIAENPLKWELDENHPNRLPAPDQD